MLVLVSAGVVKLSLMTSVDCIGLGVVDNVVLFSPRMVVFLSIWSLVAKVLVITLDMFSSGTMLLAITVVGLVAFNGKVSFILMNPPFPEVVVVATDTVVVPLVIMDVEGCSVLSVVVLLTFTTPSPFGVAARGVSVTTTKTC